MKFSRIIATIVAIACFSTLTAFAAPDTGTSRQNGENAKIEKKHFKDKDFKKFREEFSKDPIKALQGRKEKVQSLLKEGKITREKADEITARIDSKIKEIQEFNKLPLQQKKEKLVSDFKALMEKKVNSGKLTREKADTMVREFTEKIEKWDGKGYPIFDKSWFRHKSK